MLKTLVLFGCVGCEPPNPPPPPCTPGAAYSFHLGSFSPFLSPGQISNVQNLTTVDMSVFSSIYTDFRNRVRSYWHKSATVCGTQYQAQIELQNAPLPTNADIEVKQIITLPSGGGNPPPDACGTFSLGTQTTFLITLINDGGSQCAMSVTAAHEFGHNLGFDDAYNETTLAPLHSQSLDVMTVDDAGVVLAEHLKVLADKY